MEIFLGNLPPQCKEQRLKAQLYPAFKDIGVRAFDVFVFRKGGNGTLTVPTEELGQKILQKFGTPSNPRFRQAPQPNALKVGGKAIRVTRSRNNPDRHQVKALYEQQQKILLEESKPPPVPQVSSNSREKKFDVGGIECGVWNMRENRAPVFNSYYKLEHDGQMIFGRDGVRVTIFKPVEDEFSFLEPNTSHLIFFPYHGMDSIIVPPSGHQAHVTFTLNMAPRFYVQKSGGLESLSIYETTASNQRSRVSSIDENHAVFAAFCLVYRFPLRSMRAMYALENLGGHKGVIPIQSIITNYSVGDENYIQAFMSLLRQISAYEFRVAFQITALFANGSIPPDILVNLLPDINNLVAAIGNKGTAEIIQDFHANLERQDPSDRQTAFTVQRLQKDLIECARRHLRQKAQDFGLKEAMEDNGNVAFVHHAMITPAGCYFDGPKPETLNRVLRTYENAQDYFLRVTFAEEDGDPFSYERDVSQDLIYRRFKEYMITTVDGQGGKLIIGGRVFSFLGFSGASLRNHTCWFMAPFEYQGEVCDAEAIITSLGDFSHITTPGKCAARIGQAFSNTYKSVHVPHTSEKRIPDVERNGRCFSDGCATLSTDMMQRIWAQAPTIAQGHPFVFQIRFAGAKGVVSLDTSLQGDVLCLRPSMVKFEGSSARDIEICSSARRPLPMYLNRPLIKILEDLGVEGRVFLALQGDEVRRLREASHTPALAANFMERRSIGIKSLKLPWLIKALHNLGLSFQEDVFLGRAFELALLTALRDIKYRARIQIPKGFTVMGIMDEYGVLEEGEIFCHIDDEGKRSILTGEIVITRAPAMHPGDVQVCRAVDVPPSCPLRALRNCVVFSQKGERDLPSQLSGGDLDGDIYNLIFDARFRPSRIAAPADYPRVKGKELGRPVNTEDIVDFLIDFMQNDRLGLISTRHLIIADQQPDGTFHEHCIRLAHMHSTAVDFPKTGLKVEMNQLPKVGRSRPDFMAPGPHLLIDRENRYEEERDPRDDEEDDDEYGHLPTRYYESDKILGKLYRTIDERAFINEIKPEGTREFNLILDIWDYIVGFVTNEDNPIDLPWRENLEFAKDLKAEYDDDILKMMRDFSVTPTGEALQEVEVFIGCIVGKGKQNRREKDGSVAMKDGFDRLVDRVFENIRGSPDESTPNGPFDILARGMACLWVCVEEYNSEVRRRTRVGELKSFGWIAASATLQEVNDLQKKRKVAMPERRRVRQRNGLPAIRGVNNRLAANGIGLRG